MAKKIYTINNEIKYPEKKKQNDIKYIPTSSMLIKSVFNKIFPSFSKNLNNSIYNDMLLEFNKYTKIVRYDKNDEIVREGTYDDRFLYIISGSVNIIKNNDIMAVLKEGNIIGEMCLVTGEPRCASAYATSPTICLLIDASFLFQCNPYFDNNKIKAVFYETILEVMSRKLKETNAELIKYKELYNKLLNEKSSV